LRKREALRKHDGVSRFLLKLWGVCRIVCLPVIVLILRYADDVNRGGGAGDTITVRPLVFAWLVFSALVYFFLLSGRLGLVALLFTDYVMALFYTYFEHTFLIPELIWISFIIPALALALPGPVNKILPAVMGIPGAVTLSWGFTSDFSLMVLGISMPFYLAALFFYAPVTILALVSAFICSELEKIKEKNAGLEVVNTRLKELNRSVSDRVFRLQNDAAAETRKRLSKEIHDTAGYVFINLIMMLQAAQAVFRKDTGKAQKLIDEARDYAERGINEIRHLLGNIREYTPIPISLQNELHGLAESFHKATEVVITMEYGEWPPAFSRDIDAFFISFLQETLTNALKHGHASEISVLCWKSASHFGMSVRDNGTGAAQPLTFGIGITAMEDAVGKLRGSIAITSDESGFRINASIPLSAG
jgi:signal transduction histidine kinase